MCVHTYRINNTHRSFEALEIGKDYFDVCDYCHVDSNDLDLTDKLFRVIQLNVRGLINKQDKVSRLLHALGGLNKVNAVTLNETWLRTDTENKVDIPGYDYVGRIRRGKKGRGVGFLISQTQKYRDRDDLLPSNPQFESKIVELKTNNESVLVVSLYRPPNQHIDEWLTDFKILLQNLQSTGQNVIIRLDHNLDLLKSHTHKKLKNS